MTSLEKLKKEIRELGPNEFPIFRDWFWEYDTAAPENIPVNEWQKEELAKRKDKS
jgi:hypothetical protein